jgi:MIP family channel proteins
VLKRYAAELIGTFAIVFAPVALSANGGLGGLMGAAAVSGLAVLVMIFALGPISAAHFNPAVTLGFAVARRFPWRFVPAYWFAQFLGAILAAAVAMALFGHSGGAHVPVNPGAFGRNLGTEAMVTFLLMLVIIAVATDSRVPSSVPAVAIGLTVVVGVMIGGPVTGGSMNPARSLGPALFTGGAALSDVWLYLTAPFAGAAIAAGVYEAIRLEPQHAKGAPNEIFEALSLIEGSTR